MIRGEKKQPGERKHIMEWGMGKEEHRVWGVGRSTRESEQDTRKTQRGKRGEQHTRERAKWHQGGEVHERETQRAGVYVASTQGIGGES